MFNIKKARQGLNALQGKINGAQGYIAGSVGAIALAGSGSAMADPSPTAVTVTGQVTEDTNFLITWGTEIFTTVFLAFLIWKMTRKVGNKAT